MIEDDDGDDEVYKWLEVMIAKEIHALLVEGTDHWGVQVKVKDNQ